MKRYLIERLFLDKCIQLEIFWFVTSILEHSVTQATEYRFLQNKIDVKTSLLIRFEYYSGII